MTNQEDDDPVYVITSLGLRRLALEVREDAGTITKKEGRELREIRGGQRSLSQVEYLEMVIPHLKEWAKVEEAMTILSQLRGDSRGRKPRKIARHDPRFIAF